MSALFRITLRCGSCGRLTSLRTITKLLRVTAGQIGIAIGLLRRSLFHRTIRPLREVTVDPTCIPQKPAHVLHNVYSTSTVAAVGTFTGARRIAEPEALARLCGASATLKAVGRRMRCSKCGTKGAEVVAVARPRPRGVPNDSH